MQLERVVVQPQNISDGSKIVATTYLNSNEVAKDVEVDFYIADSPTWKGDRAIPVGQAYTDQSGVAAISFDFDPVLYAPAIATANQIPVQSQVQGLDNIFPQLGDRSKILYLVAYCPQAGDGVAATMVYNASSSMSGGGVAIGSGSINAQTGQGMVLTVPATATIPQATTVTAAKPSGISSSGALWLVLLVVGIVAVYMIRTRR